MLWLSTQCCDNSYDFGDGVCKIFREKHLSLYAVAFIIESLNIISKFMWLYKFSFTKGSKWQLGKSL